ncbi:pilus assembly protein TadG-related protein [Xylanimonas protaetiae]|uniref:Pilus assembly protein n=1 Tax=Xylanimonas protaetiae TaxID=2509457 RepID=A0A4V0YGL5_9MICO|nr:pilus assembly protein TadG-related protein [Xylanimonas protaetiae]QAY71631.1 pilus assembly protein [Xylanimonas protaetiae]
MTRTPSPRHALRRSGSAERGSISAWAVVSTLALILCAGLAVDLGGQVHTLQRAHDLAQQAARAGGQALSAAHAQRGDVLAVDVVAAKAEANRYLDAAGVTGTVTVTNGNEVTVTVTDTYDTILLGIIGITHLDATADATARTVRTLGGTEQ